MNKYLLAGAIIAILLSIGLFVWVNYTGNNFEISQNYKSVNLDNSSLKTYIQAARISEKSFYGVTTPAWDGLSNEKKEEIVSQILALGVDKGFVKVNLVDKQGNLVGAASGEKTEVGMQ